MISDISFKLNSPKVVQETIEGEVIIVNLDKGDYYSLTNTGAYIWSEIERGIPQNVILQKVVKRYEGSTEEIEEALSSLIEQLQQEEIIVFLPTNELNESVELNVHDQANRNIKKQPFESPTLNKYTDMEELLALDPIHEVDEMGWPNAKSE